MRFGDYIEIATGGKWPWLYSFKPLLLKVGFNLYDGRIRSNTVF
jgi:hypothetical protein